MGKNYYQKTTGWREENQNMPLTFMTLYDVVTKKHKNDFKKSFPCGWKI